MHSIISCQGQKMHALSELLEHVDSVVVLIVDNQKMLANVMHVLKNSHFTGQEVLGRSLMIHFTLYVGRKCWQGP